MPGSGDDKTRKRFVQTITARLGQAIKRRGRKHRGFTTFEKGGPADRDLHGHHILRVDDDDWDIIDRLVARHGSIIIATRLDTPSARYKKVNYVTKQRRILSPSFEKENRHTYQKNPKPVPGKRISYTKDAR